MKRKVLLSIVASLVLSSNLGALTLKDTVGEVLQTNPILKERLNHIREVQQDLNIAESEYYPSLDYKLTVGKNKAGNLKSDVKDISYRQYTNSLKLTQNIFNGFSTTNKVNYQESRILAAAHHYIEGANDVAFQMVGVYIDAIKSYRLLQNAMDNVKFHEKVYRDVKSLYKTGLTTKSEMTKVSSSLALAKANLVVQRNNTMDKEFRFKRLLGRNVNISDFTLPELDYAMPESIQRATQYAIKNNPSMLVSKYNIQGAQNLYRQKKSEYYPSVDFELEQVYDDVSKNNRFDSEDDRLKAYLTLNWNLYKGGADKSDIQKSRSTINKEVEIQRDLKRQTIESLELSWSAYEMIGKQLKMLYKYEKYNQETLSNYKGEYEMGRRTLLDLISAQNDLVNSKTQIINAQSDRLYAQYRILDAMGLLVTTILDKKDYDKFNEVITDPFKEVKDKLPVKLDVDHDGIVDSLDICDNSSADINIKPYGCEQHEEDLDFDGVPDSKDVCPETKMGLKVDSKGCKVKGSQNRFEVPNDYYTKEVAQYSDLSPDLPNMGLNDYEYSADLNKNVKSSPLSNHLMYDDFSLIKRFDFINMTNIELSDKNFQNKIAKIAEEIKQHHEKNIVVTVIGNTGYMKNLEESTKVAKAYANMVGNLLAQNGISKEYLVVQTRAYKDNVFLETYNHDKNNVVAVSLYVKDDEVKVQRDDDKDGVPNELDQCPNTEKAYKVDEKGCALKINLEVLFKSNSSKIAKSNDRKILAFAKFLRDNANYNTVITGHTSKKNANSSVLYNKKLSLERADAIKAFLVENGISENRIKTVGMGFDDPVADNDTAEGRALNRRIEAQVIDTNAK